MWVSRNCVVWSMVLILNINRAICIAVGNSKFNASLRDYSVIEDETNSANVKTLQNKSFPRYASFAPIRNPIKFKEIPDNVLSSSSHHGRGIHHEQHGYALLDYDDNSHYGHSYGYHFDPHDLHDYHHEDHTHHDYHDLHHYPHHVDHGHGYHHKHVAHALAAKTILWPIAGIALLGAAAALATNPVLLQLGVVSGRRKRRETNKDLIYVKDQTESDSFIDWFKTDPVKYLTKTHIIERKTNIQDDNLEDKSTKQLNKDALIDIIVSKQKNLPRKGTVVRKKADSDVLRNIFDDNNVGDKSIKYLKNDGLIDRILSINNQNNLPRKVTVVKQNPDSDALRNKSDDSNMEKISTKYLKNDALIERILSVNIPNNLPRKVTVVRKNADLDFLRNKSDEDKHFIPILLKTHNGKM